MDAGSTPGVGFSLRRDASLCSAECVSCQPPRRLPRSTVLGWIFCVLQGVLLEPTWQRGDLAGFFKMQGPCFSGGSMDV